MKKYILFDLDGTLTESDTGIINSVKYALDKLGLKDYDQNDLKKFIGPPLAESFSRFFGLKGEEISEAIRVYREYFADKGLFENKVYPGVPEMLGALKEKGLILAVATSKPEVYAKRIIEHFDLDRYFAIVCGIPLDDETMTKAQVVGRTLKELGVQDKTEAVMVGDRDYDVKGAHENGIECIGVTYGYGSEEELRAAGAECVVETAMGVVGVLR